MTGSAIMPILEQISLSITTEGLKTIRKSEFDVEASQYDIETIKNDISLQIAQQYLTTLLNKEIVKISQAAVENAQKQYDRSKLLRKSERQLKRFWRRRKQDLPEKSRI